MGEAPRRDKKRPAVQGAKSAERDIDTQTRQPNRPLAEALIVAGHRIGPYEVVKRIGSGGMGTVYLCVSCGDAAVPAGRQVAVKVLKSSNSEERRRFERESRYLQSLQHPGIVRVLDTGEDQGRLYLVMPLIDGRRLDDVVGPKHQALAEEKAIDWMVQALEALHVAHISGILHRDLKPGNLMIDRDDRVRLLDFGLASAPDVESRMTRDGDVVGTPAYMPPEQAAGRRDEISRRSDIYSMGACLFELVTGKQPYSADNAMATLRAIIDEPLTLPSRFRPDLSRDLETVIVVAMAKDQRDRYRTAEEMAGDLRRIRNGLAIRARRVSAVRKSWRWLVQHRRAVAMSSLAMFVTVAVGSVLVVRALRQHRTQTAVEVATAVTPTWAVEWQAVYPSAGDTKSPRVPANLNWNDHPPFGPGVQVAALPGIDGPARLSASIALGVTASPGVAAELLVGDRDIGYGYRLRIILGTAEDRLELQREGRTVASRSLGQIARGTTVDVVLEQQEGNLASSVSWMPLGGNATRALSFPFFDLVPLQGPDANGVYLVRGSGAIQIAAAKLERIRSGELVSALAPADVARQEKRYARAQQLYQAFLHDHPTSPQAKDARLRLGLSQEGLNDLAGALTTFTDATTQHRDDSRYVLVATFHAWTCALRLGRYPEAERYFEAIRRAYDLETLVASIPEQTLRDLRQDYHNRAQIQATIDRERATFLALTGAEIANYLGDLTAVADGYVLAGYLLIADGRPTVARETVRRVGDDQRFSAQLRAQAITVIGHSLRMDDNPQDAAAAYRRALILANADLRGRIRLWLGDLAQSVGDNELAVSTWSEPESGVDPVTARLLHVLADGSPTSDPVFAQDPDGAYFIARVGQQAQLTPSAINRLRELSTGTAWRWPAPLARKLVEAADKAAQQQP